MDMDMVCMRRVCMSCDSISPRSPPPPALQGEGPHARGPRRRGRRVPRPPEYVRPDPECRDDSLRCEDSSARFRSVRHRRTRRSDRRHKKLFIFNFFGRPQRIYQTDLWPLGIATRSHFHHSTHNTHDASQFTPRLLCLSNVNEINHPRRTTYRGPRRHTAHTHARTEVRHHSHTTSSPSIRRHRPSLSRQPTCANAHQEVTAGHQAIKFSAARSPPLVWVE